jgi:hypothetical protein
MATKQEVKDIELAIETHRTTNPNMANGLIQALAIVNDDDKPDYIPAPKQSSEPRGSFACALIAMFNGESVRLKGWPAGDRLKFIKHKFYHTSDLRGREMLTEIPLEWITIDTWEPYDEPR